jgi:hypothetical protein
MDSKIIDEYLSSLTPKEYKGYLIAKSHLAESFQVEKSNGFLSWVKNNMLSKK